MSSVVHLSFKSVFEITYHFQERLEEYTDTPSSLNLVYVLEKLVNSCLNIEEVLLGTIARNFVLFMWREIQ